MMARRNPPRAAKRALLAVGEGSTETALLRHLKALYDTRDSGLTVKVENAHGGSPNAIVNSARKLVAAREYAACLIVMDTDRPWPDETRRKRGFGTTRVVFARADPCIEGLLLDILDFGEFNPKDRSSRDCQRAFHARFLSGDEKIDQTAYAKLLPRELLESRRAAVPSLDLILRFLTGRAP